MRKEEQYHKAIYNHLGDEKTPTDLTFIVNKPRQTLKDRFNQLIKDCKFFDSPIAYFLSEFHAICKPLEKTKRIRILIGLGITKETYKLIRSVKDNYEHSFQFSHSETKLIIENAVENIY